MIDATEEPRPRPGGRFDWLRPALGPRISVATSFASWKIWW